MKIAILEDDPVQLRLITHVIDALGHSPRGYQLGKDLMNALTEQRFDMLILDWHLPDLSGIEVLKRIRRREFHQIPSLFVSSRGREEDIVTALSAGADDYMVKPIGVEELSARIKAIQRRAFRVNARPLIFGNYVLGLTGKTVTLRGEVIELATREFDVAFFMFRHVGQLLSRKDFQEGVWRSIDESTSRSIDTYVSRVRTKLQLGGDHGYQLTSVYREGYRLDAVDVPARKPKVKL